jgi:hypothetical protein
LDAYEIGTIIDFPKTNSNSVTCNNYKNTRDRLVANGTVHYDALQCYNNLDGAQRIYELGPGVTLEILYQPYYETNTSNENDYSVCVRIVQDGKQYLFTGDLDANGERGLVKYYNDNYGGLGHCVLWKGGHHGSQTSAQPELMAAITPEYVIICTCIGSSEYNANPLNTFPAQSFIDRVAPYTDKIYATTLMISYSSPPAGTYEPNNGNIIFMVRADGEIEIICSGHDKILKDTDWFLANRTMPEDWKPP